MGNHSLLGESAATTLIPLALPSYAPYKYGLLSTPLFLGVVLEGYFYGLYSGIFVMYIQYQVSNKSGGGRKNILFFALCALYILSAASVAIDAISFIVGSEAGSYLTAGLFDVTLSLMYGRWLKVYRISIVINCLCDFISQAILIYRCWIVWGCKTRIIIIPSILALSFLATWLATITIRNHAGLLSLVLSLTVNASVTGLIVFRIVKVYREVRSTMEDKALGIAGGSNLRPIIFIIVESGMALFAIQVIRIYFTATHDNNNRFFISIHQMMNGITPTIILVRVSMKLSYHDESSMVEAAYSLCFASSNQSIPETGNIDIVGQARMYDIGIPQCDDIEVGDI